MDVERLRSDVPLLERAGPRGPLVYFDNACTTLKPRPVIEAVHEYYESYPVCGERSLHRLGRAVTDRVEEARRRVARFVGAGRPEELVFTKNATEAINLVAHGIDWRPGDVVVTTDKEHNSNWVPWLHLRNRAGVAVRAIPSTPEGEFDEAAMDRVLDEAGDRLRLVSLAHVSNADGVATPVERVARAAHARGALVLADAAQSAPGRSLDVARLGVDFLAASVHKMMGPSGLGFLYGRTEAFESLGPFQLGGNTVQRSRPDGFDWQELPHRYEAGLQNYAALWAVPATLDGLERLGVDSIGAHASALNTYATRRLGEVDGVQIYGPPAERRNGILPFNVGGFDAAQVAAFLDERSNVALRSGAHCVHAYFARRRLEGWVRASFYAYNTPAEVDVFAEGVEELARGRRGRRPVAGITPRS